MISLWIFQIFCQSLSDIESFKVKLSTYQYTVSSIATSDELYFLCFSKNNRGTDNTLLVVDKTGTVKHRFQENGQGPGELRRVSSLAIVGDQLLAAERTSGLVHVYNKQLQHVMDIKTQLGGAIFAVSDNKFAIWNTHRQSFGLTYMSRIYNVNKRAIDAKPVYAVEIPTDEIPVLIQAWGGIQRTKDGFVAIKSTDYKVEEFNLNGHLLRTIVNKQPAHLQHYQPYEGDPQRLNKQALNWMWSFSKMRSVHLINEDFGIFYLDKSDEGYLDIVDKAGAFIAKKIPFGNKVPVTWKKNRFLYTKRVENNGDFDFYLKWAELNLK